MSSFEKKNQEHENARWGCGREAESSEPKKLDFFDGPTIKTEGRPPIYVAGRWTYFCLFSLRWCCYGWLLVMQLCWCGVEFTSNIDLYDCAGVLACK